MDKYYVVKTEAIPEVLIKVVEAKKLLDSGAFSSVKEAADAVGISRSSFYKYKDNIFPFNDHTKGKTITLSIQLKDEPGVLSGILAEVAKSDANILTIHQSIPVSGFATVSLSCELDASANVDVMVDNLESNKGIKSVKILAAE